MNCYIEKILTENGFVISHNDKTIAQTIHRKQKQN